MFCADVLRTLLKGQVTLNEHSKNGTGRMFVNFERTVLECSENVSVSWAPLHCNLWRRDGQIN